MKKILLIVFLMFSSMLVMCAVITIKYIRTINRMDSLVENNNNIIDALLDVQCRLDSIQEGRTWIWVAPCSRKCKEAGFHH
jgi:hypothetical protein